MIEWRSFLCCLGLVICLTACGEGEQSPPQAQTATPVVWRDLQDPATVFTIGPAAEGGLSVVDVSGAELGRFGSGGVSAIDVRDRVSVTTDNGNPDTARTTVIVAATNTSDKTLTVAALDSVTGGLSPVLADPLLSKFDTPQALCLYRSAVNGNLYVFASDADGTFSQWLLYDSGLGTLRHTIMRTWPVGAPVLRCRANDNEGWVDVTTADGSQWRYGAEPKDNFKERAVVN